MQLLLCLSTGLAAAAPDERETIVYRCDFDGELGTLEVDPYKQGASLAEGDKHSGGRSMRCRGNSKYYQYFGRVPHIALRPGRSYRLSVWAKASADPVVLVHLFFTHDRKWPSPPRSGTLKCKPSPAWKRYETVFMVPPEFNGGELRFRLVTSSPEVIAHFDDLTLSLLPPRLEAEYHCASRKDLLTVKANVAGFIEREPVEAMTVTVDIVDAGGKPAASHRLTELTDIVSELTCPIAALAAGDYQVVVKAVGSAGAVLGTRTLPLRVVREAPWQGNKLGILPADADAPPPWTNVTVRDQEVDCWGRTHRLGPTGLPASVRVLDQEILAGPIRLDMGKPHGSLTASLDAATKQKATFVSRWSSGNLKATAHTEIEFDGMLKYTLELAPSEKGRATLSGLALEVPLTPEVGKLLHRVLTDLALLAGGLSVDLTRTPQWQAKDFVPHVWVGNDERGLAWFAESDNGWHVKRGPRIRVTRGKDAVVLRVTMIDTPVEVAQPMRFTFGLQATPVRPPRPGWKAMRYRTKTLPMTLNVLWGNAKYDKYQGFPQAADDPTAFKTLMASVPRALRLIYLSFCYDGVPEFRFFEDRWRAADVGYLLDGTGFDGRLVSVDHTDPLWQDFIIWKLDRWIRRWKAPGMYHDCFGPLKKDGAWQIFAFRELAKRSYVLHRQIVPDALTIVFAQGYVPIISFSDTLLSGEMYRTQLAEHGWYTAFLGLGEFRADNAVRLGPERMILPQYRMAYGNSVPHAVHAMGLYLLHDLTVYASWFNMDVYDDLETRRIRFGRDKATFVPYWRPGGRVDAGKKGLVVSYYEKPDALMVVVVNPTGKRIEDTLRIDTRQLRLGAKPMASVYDPVNRATRRVQLGTPAQVSVTVPARLMVLIEIASGDGR